MEGIYAWVDGCQLDPGAQIMGVVRRAFQLVLIIAFWLIPAMPAVHPVSANDIGSYAFQRIWNRTDQPVETHTVNRTWMWGPQPFTDVMLEPYAEGNVAGQQGVRRVQYFDKSRMEITDSTADPSSDWYVTNGLLAKEMITGRMQVGDNSYVDYGPAEINVAGDENDPNAPTYATFSKLMNYQALPDGWTITQTLDRHGNVGSDPTVAALNVTAGHYVPESKHDIASVFWDFINASGPTFNGYQTTDTKLFSNPFFATGLPITEPYWTTVNLAGTPTKVLVQAFERRVLTYTPSNSDGWKVEAGNVGRHYYEWRYGSDLSSALVTSNVSASKDMNGNWMFLGEITNKARVPYSNVSVTVKLISRQGDVVASQSDFLDFSSVQPAAVVPFRVWFDSGQSYDHADTTVTGTIDPIAQTSQLTVVMTTSEYLTSGDYHIQAIVRNDSGKAISRPSYVVAMFQSGGDIFDYNAGFLTLGTLQPGQSGKVDATFYDPPNGFSRYRIFVAN